MASLQDIFKQIDDRVTELKRLLPLKPEDQQRLDKKFRLEFNYNSNHLEGNTLTYGETELLLIFDKTKGDHEKREYDEMSGHDSALRMIQEEAKDTERPLTEQFIRLLNEQLLVRPFWKEAITQDGQPTRKEIIPGQYKTTPNSVRLQNGEIFEYASPADAPIKMQELVDWYNENSTKEHPLLLASLLHYRFVCIHPFDDGNGRVSRLLMNYVLLKNHLPMIVVQSNEKKAYLNALNKADVGETDAFVNYLGEQLLWSLNLYIKAAKGEDIEETDDWEKEIELIKRKVSDKSNTGKSPKLVYNVFTKYDGELRPIVKDILEGFSTLFNEEKNFHYLNGKNEISEPLFNQVDRIRTGKLAIFGYDPYVEDVKSITWKQKKYALRGAKKVTDYEVNLGIYFEHNRYIVNVTLNNKNIFSLHKSYTDFILSYEIGELDKALKSAIIEQIKRDTK